MRLISVAVLTAVLAPVCVTEAMAESLSFYDALTAALRNAPSVQARRAEIAATTSAAIAAGRLPDPKLRFGLQNFPISGPSAGSFSNSTMTMMSVGIVQDVPNAAKRKAERQMASADIDLADANARVENHNVRLNTALAWVDLYYAHEKLAVLDLAQQTIRTIGATTPSQLTAATIRPAQSLEADQLDAGLSDRRAELIAEITRARAELVRWTGDDTADVSGNPPDLPVVPSALRADLDRNPLLRPYDASTQQAEAGVAMARANKRSDWGWDVTYQHRDPRWGEMVTGGITLSLPLFSKTRQDPEIDARMAETTRARLDQNAARRQLQAQLDADLANYQMHRDLWQRAQTVLVPLAEKKVELDTASYAAGSANLLEVLHAQLALAEARIDALSREDDVVRDTVRINLTYESDNP